MAKQPSADRITIEGKGTIPIHVDGAMTRLPRGKPIAATAEQIAFLKANDVKFSKGK